MGVQTGSMRRYCSSVASVTEAMHHVSAATRCLRTALTANHPTEFDARLASASASASQAHQIVREMSKYEEADHVPLSWPLYNCLGLVHHLKKNHTAAEEALRTALQSVEAGARQGLTHDAYIDLGGVLSDLGCTLTAAGEVDKAQAAFGRALYMCSRAYHRDAQTISMIQHNMAVAKMMHGDELESARDSIDSSIQGLAPAHIDGQSASAQKDPHTRGQALLVQSSSCAKVAVWLRDREPGREWDQTDLDVASEVGGPQLMRLGEGLSRSLEPFEKEP